VRRRPLRIISLASLLGIARGSRTSPPAPDLAERERGGGVGDDQVACERDLTTAAHGVAFAPAMTGLGMCCRLVRPSNPFLVGTHVGFPCPVQMRSFPAENAVVPAPVRMATQGSGPAK
jgi:hypothetical protein